MSKVAPNDETSFQFDVTDSLTPGEAEVNVAGYSR